ncbi:hypothetical protein J3Q64DRAFT_1737442 [Phycomyces blakesleeanus]|uniref:Ricin B lectin domain-containing protein n=1 Tax=Phycomyces blakesleeanus TaxID=4837 RepID=A0ABR3B120_PHYBL
MSRPSYFYLLSHKHKYALDIYDGQTKPDANLIVWPQKFEDSDNQLWTYDNGYITNKKSNLVLDIKTSFFKKDKMIAQNKRVEGLETQLWDIQDGFISSQMYPSMVFTIKNNSPKGGAQIILSNRKEVDNLDQLWHKESYGIFESSLIAVTASGPLHKKEGFGKPRLGYGAEVGVPPELKSLPEKSNIAGLGANVDTTPTPTVPENSADYVYDPSLPENMANMYPRPSQTQSGYQAKPAPQPSFSNGPPSNYSSYPPPSSPPNRYQAPQQQPNGYPPQQQQENAYPPQQQQTYAYPPPQQQANSYPPPQNQSNVYPPQQHKNVYPPTQPQYPPEGDYQPQPPYSPQGGHPGGFSPQMASMPYPGSLPPGPPGPPPMAGGFYRSPPPGGMPSPSQSQTQPRPYVPSAQDDPYGGYGPPPPLPQENQYNNGINNNNHYNYNYQ